MLKCRFLKNGVLVKHKLISQLILLLLDFDGLRRFESGLVFGHVFHLFFITFIFQFVNEIAKLWVNLFKRLRVLKKLVYHLFVKHARIHSHEEFPLFFKVSVLRHHILFFFFCLNSFRFAPGLKFFHRHFIFHHFRVSYDLLLLYWHNVYLRLFNWGLLLHFLCLLLQSFWLLTRKKRAKLRHSLIDIPAAVIEKIFDQVALNVRKHLTNILNLLLLFFLRAHVDFTLVLPFNKSLHFNLL